MAPGMTVELIMAVAAKMETSENILETQLEVRICKIEQQNSPIFLERAAG